MIREFEGPGFWLLTLSRSARFFFFVVFLMLLLLPTMGIDICVVLPFNLCSWQMMFRCFKGSRCALSPALSCILTNKHTALASSRRRRRKSSVRVKYGHLLIYFLSPWWKPSGLPTPATPLHFNLQLPKPKFAQRSEDRAAFL